MTSIDCNCMITYYSLQPSWCRLVRSGVLFTAVAAPVQQGLLWNAATAFDCRLPASSWISTTGAHSSRLTEGSRGRQTTPVALWNVACLRLAWCHKQLPKNLIFTEPVNPISRRTNHHIHNFTATLLWSMMLTQVYPEAPVGPNSCKRNKFITWPFITWSPGAKAETSWSHSYAADIGAWTILHEFRP